MKKRILKIAAFCLAVVLIVGVCWFAPLLKESKENSDYREKCRRRGDKTYWSTDGLRYTDTNQKVYK